MPNFLGLRHKSWQALKQDLVNSKIYKSDCKDKEKKRVTYIVFQHSPEQSHKLITRVFLAGVMKIVCPFYLHLLHGKSATEVGIQEVGHAVTLFSFCFLLRNRELLLYNINFFSKLKDHTPTHSYHTASFWNHYIFSM